MQALVLLAHHPPAWARMISYKLCLTQVLPADAAVRLKNLRELQMEECVSTSDVQALECLLHLTSLTVQGLSANAECPVLSPTDDLPPRLQVLSMRNLHLYGLERWLPVLTAVSWLMRCVAVHTCLL
jgi:hypothetical protein